MTFKSRQCRNKQAVNLILFFLHLSSLKKLEHFGAGKWGEIDLVV